MVVVFFDSNVVIWSQDGLRSFCDQALGFAWGDVSR